MPHAKRREHRFDAHAFHGGPREGDPVRGKGEAVAAAAGMPQVLARPLQREHGIERAFVQRGGFLRDGKRELRGVGEFFVFFVLVHVFPGVIARGVRHHLPIFGVPGQQQAYLLVQESGRRRVRLFLGLPEGVILGQRQGEEGLHAPVGRAGRVVAFGRAQVGIAVADGQRPAAVKDGHAQPEAQIAQQHMLHFAPAEPFGGDAREGHGGPERALGEAVGQAAPVGQRAAFPVEPAGEARRDEPRALHETCAALRIGVPHGGGVDQAVIMEGPDSVIIALGGVIKVPAVAHVMAFHHVQILGQPRLIDWAAHLLKADVDQDAEIPPVVLGHVVQVDLVQPAVQIVLFFGTQILPEALRNKAQAGADHRHFHHALVVIADRAPVSRVRGIGSVNDALLPQFPEGFGFGTAADQHGHKRPQHAGEAFHPGHVLGIMGRALAYDHPRFFGRQAIDQGGDHLNRRPRQILTGAQRVALNIKHAYCSS